MKRKMVTIAKLIVILAVIVGVSGIDVEARSLVARQIEGAHPVLVMSPHLVIKATYTISGRVTDSDGSSVEGVTIQATRVPTTGKPVIVFIHGWQGLNFDWDYSCDTKITNYDPGVSAKPYGSYFLDDSGDGLPKWIFDDGYEIWFAHLDTNPDYTPPLEENAQCLKDQIAQVRDRDLNSKVILIAHSMGGLVSRAYIEGLDYGDDVSTLFTLGSPHLGVPVDVLAFFFNGLSLGEACENWQPAVCEFSKIGIKSFNSDYSERRKGLTYHVISGDAPFLSRNVYGMIMFSLIDGSDDGAVQTDSGIGLSGVLDRKQTDEVHSNAYGSRSYFIRDGGQSASYVQCLKLVLADDQANCGTVSPQQLVIHDSANDLGERTPLEFGTQLAEQITKRTVSLEGGSTLFAAQWVSGTFTITLTDPNGQTIDSDYAANHAGEVTYIADSTTATYYFTNTITGEWQLVLQAGSDVPVGGSDYTTFVAFDSSLALTATTDKSWYTPGATATITATLSDSPINATVTAMILLADGITNTISLSLAGADLYQGTYTVPNAPGYAEVRMVATGFTSGGEGFERGLNTAFQISPSSISLTGSYTEAPQPRSPGSYFYEALDISASVNVVSGGTYGLSADLVDGEGNLIAHSLTITNVTSGSGTLTLRFNGDDIHESLRSGPYTLTNLLLTDKRGTTLVAAETQDVYITDAYDYHQFGIGRIYLPFVTRGGGVQMKGNGNRSPGEFSAAVAITYTATTGADGYYTLSELSEGTYTLVASKGSSIFSPETRTASIPPSRANQDFTLQSGGEPPIPPVETWLDQVNGYREQAGVPTVNEDFTHSYNCNQHAQYMAENELLTHDQIPGLPFASFEGQLCAQNGLVWLSDFSAPYWLPKDSIDAWMGSVGHRIWMLYPTTTTFGYGFYTAANNRTGAALDVLSAANFVTDGGYLGWPVRYPAPGQIGIPATAYPITLNWRYYGDIPIITSTSLTTASGTPIYHVAGNVLEAGHKGIKILPNTALPDDVVFVVNVTGNYGGIPFSYSWKFSTGDTPIP